MLRLRFMEREKIQLAKVYPSTTTGEQFQNEVIRPVIKLKHEWLITVSAFYIKNNKANFQELTAEKQVNYLETALQKDQTFRPFLLGAVVSEFTMEELKQYHALSTDLNKRIITIILKRLTDSLSEIIQKII